MNVEAPADTWELPEYGESDLPYDMDLNAVPRWVLEARCFTLDKHRLGAKQNFTGVTRPVEVQCLFVLVGLLRGPEAKTKHSY